MVYYYPNLSTKPCYMIKNIVNENQPGWKHFQKLIAPTQSEISQLEAPTQQTPNNGQANQIGYAMPPLCALCESQAESCRHLFYYCGFTQQVWAHLSKCLKSNTWDVSDWSNGSWLQEVRSNQLDFQSLILFIWQQVCKTRNGAIFKAEKGCLVRLVDSLEQTSTTCSSNKVLLAKEKRGIKDGTKASRSPLWVNTDGAWYRRSNEVGVGYIIRDSIQSYLKCISCYCNSVKLGTYSHILIQLLIAMPLVVYTIQFIDFQHQKESSQREECVARIHSLINKVTYQISKL